MLKNIKCIAGILSFSLLTISSCTKEDKTFGDLTAPTAPVIDVQVVGKTTAAPFGDSSGKVIVTITSTNAINYKVSFGDGLGDSLSTKNQYSYSYTHIGLKTINVTVTSTGKGGIASTTTSAAFSVYRKFIPSAELVTMLTNDASKIWMIDSVELGHVGVGAISLFIPNFYPGPPEDKKGVGLYDDEFTFTKGTGSFTHKTNNSLFGKQENLKDFDATLAGTGDYTLLGSKAATYTEPFSYDGTGSGASATEFILFGAKGHMGIYTGGHKYQVLTKSATQMSLRYIGTDGNAWYVKIKAK